MSAELPTATTPRAVENPPGRERLDARVGTHGAFLRTTLDALGRRPALAALTTRDIGDPTIALLDAAATVLDVLTFYRERITNEGYLATATERRSVVELARTIGYEPNPGVAAATHLAFELDAVPGSPTEVALAAGTRAQSTPREGELPHVFETTTDLVAHVGLAALAGRTTQPATPRRGDTQVTIAGTASRLVVGDRVLLVGREREASVDSERWDVRIVVAVQTHDADPSGAGPPAHSVLTFNRPLGTDRPVVAPAADEPAIVPLRTRAALFGYNAMAWKDLPLPLRVGERHPVTNTLLPGPYASRSATWADANFAAATRTLWLDQTYPAATPGAWLVLSSSAYEELYGIDAAIDEVHSDYLLSAQTTRVDVDGEHIAFFSPKEAVVWLGSERFALADPPRTDPIGGDEVPLDVAVDPLVVAGRLVAISGIDAVTGETVAEVRAVIAVRSEGIGSVLDLDRPLERSYVPASVRVNANVTPVTHGESWSETLGSGDASRPWTRLRLANGPLTYVRAPTPSGGESTLAVRIAGVAWRQVDTLYGQPPGEQVYTVVHADDGSTTVEFGPSSRPPSGTTNITAQYRVGVGLSGNVAAGAINVPLSRPLGLKGLVNPVAATGGADVEAADDARHNAPLPIKAMGRVVSLEDFRSFATAFAGIAKARADAVWNGERRVVHVTIASATQQPIAADDRTITDLVLAIDAARHVETHVIVAGHQEIRFGLRATLEIDPRYIADDVVAAARDALAQTFSFTARELAAPVRDSDVLAALHAVDGVLGAILAELHPVPGTGRADIVALPARWSAGSLAPAQLVVIDPDEIDLTRRQP